MATATKEVEVVETITTVTLTLTAQEASWLRRLLFSWGSGVPFGPHGRILNNIHTALCDTGIEAAEVPAGKKKK